jgi:hypothetical protein
MPTLENVNIRKPNGDAVCYAARAVKDDEQGNVRLTEAVTVYRPLSVNEAYRLEDGEGALEVRYAGSDPHGHPTFVMP